MKNKKIALIFGITGQDGSYLARFLLKKKYKVHGVKRRSSSLNTERIDDIYEDNLKKKKNFFLYYGDVTDAMSVLKLISLIKPDEIYNLAAQSHVAVSFEIPEYTANADALGTLRILEGIKSAGLEKKCKFYQAGTSEMFGKVLEIPQNEKTPFRPRSPYAISKLYSYWQAINYREAYNIFAVNGILFNHEGPRRGETFVSRKITRFVASYAVGKEKILYLGNLNAKRDWGSAKDYVETMWLMLQKSKPSDYVIATGVSRTVKNFVEEAFKNINIKIKWRGKGAKEVGFDQKTKKIIVKIDPGYFRPTEIDELRGDSKKARRELKWKPKTNFKSMVKEMVLEDIKRQSIFSI